MKENNKEIQQKIAENVTVYNTCLTEVAKKIDRTVMGTGEYALTPTDVKDIASTVFIQSKRELAREQAEIEPATDAQKGFVSGLIPKKGKRAEEWFANYLQEHDYENGEKLTKVEASEVITALKEI